MDARIKNLLSKVAKENICVVTHAGTLRAMMPILKDQPKETSFGYEFQNASITVFEGTEFGYNQVLENSIDHLDS